jgi:cytochrome c553
MIQSLHKAAVVTAIVAGLSSLAMSAQASDIAAGKAKAVAACISCHGADGNKTIDPSYPKLAGQHKDFLVRALMDYKSGARKNAIMSAQAAQLTKADMQNISAYFASLPGQIETRK